MVGGGKDREEMREILFKAKRIDNGEWVEGFLLIKYYQELPHDRFAIRYKTKGDEHEWTPKYLTTEIDPGTVCQYTGLTDKNGNKIWENDIIQYIDGELSVNGVIRFGRHEQIVMLELGFYVEWVSKETECFKTDICYWVEKRDIEVIGNIFDNACIDELLKGEEG